MMKKEGYKLNLMAQFEPLVRLRIFYRGHGKQKKMRMSVKTIFKISYEHNFTKYYYIISLLLTN